MIQIYIGGNFKYFFCHHDPWELMIQFDEHIFSNGLVQPPMEEIHWTWMTFMG